MKISNIIYLLSMVSVGFTLTQCSEKKEQKSDRISKAEQVIELKENYEDVIDVFTKRDDVLYVVNFWATWCQPCVEELPDFMKANEKYKENENFRMILISLDRARDFDGKVKDFVSENKITPDVYLLSDNKRMNEWIRKINATWGGEIPATAFYRNGKQVKFISKSMHFEELDKEIKTLLN